MAEDQFIESTCEKVEDYSIWFGLRGNLTAGFEYDDGSSFDYDNWAEGQPSGEEKECVQKVSGNGHFQWYTQYCYYDRLYVCKRAP